MNFDFPFPYNAHLVQRAGHSYILLADIVNVARIDLIYEIDLHERKVTAYVPGFDLDETLHLAAPLKLW